MFIKILRVDRIIYWSIVTSHYCSNNLLIVNIGMKSQMESTMNGSGIVDGMWWNGSKAGSEVSYLVEWTQWVKANNERQLEAPTKQTINSHQIHLSLNLIGELIGFVCLSGPIVFIQYISSNNSIPISFVAEMFSLRWWNKKIF